MTKKKSNQPKLYEPQKLENSKTNNKPENLHKDQIIENAETAEKLFVEAYELTEKNFYKEAIEIFKKIEHCYQSHCDFHAQLGYCHYKLYDYTPVRYQILKSVKLGNTDPNVLNILATIYLHDKKYNKGIGAMMMLRM